MTSPSPTQPNASGSFSLFPHPSASQPKPLPSNNPYRKGTPRPGAQTPQSSTEPEFPFPPRTVRSTTPQSRSRTPSSPSPPSPALAGDAGRQRALSRATSIQSMPSSGNRSPQEGPRRDLQLQEFVASGRPETPPSYTHHEHTVSDVPLRTGTAFSQAPTMVRTQSTRSRSSIAKRPFPVDDGEDEAVPQQALRSMFPQYNPTLPLDKQDYFPTQQSPTHIPHEIISRQPYSPTGVDSGRSPPPLRSPGHVERHHHHHHHSSSFSQPGPSSLPAAVAGPSGQQHQRQQHSWGQGGPENEQPMPPQMRLFEPEADPEISGTDELRGLWKVANGWKASAFEGRSYAMRVSAERDAPVYNLLSATGQPFYNLRIDPRATTAYVILARRDPSKPYKVPKGSKSGSRFQGGSSSPGGGDILMSPATLGSSPISPASPAASVNTSGKGWAEVLTTVVEEPERRLPPNDGLVSMLYPLQAQKMALARPDDDVAVMTAERECARLVYDPDSGCNYLVHPTLATPFRVTTERHAAQCRTEYVLEHAESPRHLARLVRDGTGGGFIEVDTAVASRVDAVYVVDIAVTALLIVANEDEKERKIEMFEPPPPPAAYMRGSNGDHGSRSNSRLSMSSRLSRREERRERERAHVAAGGRKFESFEIDVESQASSLAKMRLDKDEKKQLPTGVRVVLKLGTWAFKAVFWIFLTMFKAMAVVLRGLTRCCGERDK